MPEAAQAGVTPLDIAVKHGFDEVAQAIVSLRAQDLQGVCWTECASPTQSSQVPGGQRACAASVGRYIALCKTSISSLSLCLFLLSSFFFFLHNHLLSPRQSLGWL